MSELSELERENGRIAWKVVDDAGGFLTFREYDAAMEPKKYFTPINWINGCGDRYIWKSNNDKLCAFAAVKMGLLKQTDTGYSL